MKRHERDLDLIDVILADCGVLSYRLWHFEMDADAFISNRSDEGEIAYDAVMSPVYRIAEDALHLSDEVMAEYPDYPWNDIRGFRNFVAHGYREVDRRMAWEVIERDIPELARILKRYKEAHPL